MKATDINYLKNNIIPLAQNGFLPKKSTESAMYKLLHLTLTGLDRKDESIGIFLHISEAFDTIDH